MGEFDTDHLRESPDLPYPAILFILSTFMVQIVILNMLIAIMGETYDKVVDQFQETIMLERAEILSDHLPVSVYNFDTCIYMIKPLNSDLEEVDWTGRLKDIKDAYVKTSTKVQNTIIHKVQ